MPMTSREMVRFLKKHGFRQIPGGKGSHRKMINPKTGKSTLVPYHKGEMRKGTEQSILKEAGLK